MVARTGTRGTKTGTNSTHDIGKNSTLIVDLQFENLSEYERFQGYATFGRPAKHAYVLFKKKTGTNTTRKVRKDSTVILDQHFEDLTEY